MTTSFGNLSSSRSPADHLLSGAIGSLLGGESLAIAARAGSLGAAAVAASNAIARRDYAGAALAAAAGWGANKILGEIMNPYLEQNPYLADEKAAKKAQQTWAQQCAQGGNWQGGAGWGAGNGWGGARGMRGMLGSPMVKGMLIGAAVAYLLSNKDAKASIIKGVAKLQNLAAAAVEEIKEQIEDAKASLENE